MIVTNCYGLIQKVQKRTHAKAKKITFVAMSKMQPEHYGPTMKTYADEKLIEMLKDPATYHDDAMLAAIWEADKRMLNYEGLPELKSKYEQIYSLVLQAERNREEEAQQKAREVDEPELYTPGAIFWLTVLFNTLFGGFMMAYNLNKINKKAQTQVFVFTILYTVGGLFAVTLVPLGSIFPIVYNITGAFILRDYFWKRFMPLRQRFKVKSLQTPLLIGIGYSVVLIVVLYFFGNQLIPQPAL